MREQVDPALVLARAEAALRAGDGAVALSLAEQAIAADPRGWVTAAAACELLGRPAELRMCVDNAGPITGGDRRHERLVAVAGLTRGRSPGDVADPVDGGILDAAEARFAAGDVAGAFSAFADALIQDPTCARAWTDLGVTLSALGDRDGALAALKAALRTSPGDPDALLSLARLELAGPSPERAAPHARAMGHDPEGNAILRDLGVDREPPKGKLRLTAALSRRLVADRVAGPLISVIVPTYDRHDCLVNLLDRLAMQTLDPRLFEVVAVDDGSPIPVDAAVAGHRYPYALRVVRQANAGPARARNTAIALAKAPFLLILNDDAVIALDNLERHLCRQLDAKVPTTVLGRFDFTEEALQSPVVEVFQRSALLFEYVSMSPGDLHGWKYFYTCNLSIPKAAVDAVGGFDASFPDAVCEDTELGVRLEKQLAMKILYDDQIVARHDHRLDVHSYVRRQVKLGINNVRLWRKHPEIDLVAQVRGDTPVEDYLLELRGQIERNEANNERLVAEIDALDREAAALPPGHTAREPVIEALRSALAKVSQHEYARGIVAGMAGLSAVAVSPRKRRPLRDRLVSVVIPNLNGWPHVTGAIGSLRAHADGPIDLVVVDNGSDDASLPWLRSQPDVRLVELGYNAGAPTARNCGLELAQGDSVVLCDNDVIFTPAWRRLLLDHLDRWPDVGMVGPMSDNVVGAQRVATPPTPGDDLDAWARAFTVEHAGDHAYTARLILFFLVARRELLDRIGGIDPIYDPWGFEDDDLGLRARAAGFQLRIAGDCFVRHLGSRTSATAKIDYRALLLRNWEIFKRRWRLPQDLPYGEIPVSRILSRSWRRDELFVPIRPLLATGG